MRVLGIDPGSRATGFAILEATPQGVKALKWGVFRLKKGPLPQRLWEIFTLIEDLVEEFSPLVMALEEVIPERFPRAALKLGQAQGAAILAATKANLPVFFYHPLEVKQALTGQGKAPKRQVAFVVKHILGLNGKIPLDATDALSVGLYHIQTHHQREAMCLPA